MRDNTDTDPETVFASGTDPFNTILNVGKQESLGLASSGVAPGMSGNGGRVDANGWLSFTSGSEAVQVPGQYSESPVFVGGTGTSPVAPNPTLPVSGGYGGGGGSHFLDPIEDDPFDGGFYNGQNAL